MFFVMCDDDAELGFFGGRGGDDVWELGWGGGGGGWWCGGGGVVVVWWCDGGGRWLLLFEGGGLCVRGRMVMRY